MTDRSAWRDRYERGLIQRGVDETVIRQLAGQARRFADVAGHGLTAADVLGALDDTGLAFVVDSEGFAGTVRRCWAVMVVAADPLDQEPAVDSHWDQEAEDRDAAARRPTRRRLEDE